MKLVAVRVGTDPKNFVGVPVPLVVRVWLVRSVGGVLVEGPVAVPLGVKAAGVIGGRCAGRGGGGGRRSWWR